MNLIHLKESPQDVVSLIMNKLKYRYGDNLLLFGTIGSLANNTFTSLSDFDLIAITKGGDVYWHEYMYGTTYIDVRMSTMDVLIKELRHVIMRWPFKVGGILNIKPYYELNNTLSVFTDIYETLKRDKKEFEQAVELNTFTAQCTKAHRAFQNKNYVSLYWSAVELVKHFACVIALINQSYYTSENPIIIFEQIKTFKFTPPGWDEAYSMALDHESHTTIKGIMKIWDIIFDLKDKYDFRDFSITSLDQIAF